MCLFILAALGLYCCMGFSLVVGSEGYSPVAVHRLLITEASCIVEHGLWGAQAPHHRGFLYSGAWGAQASVVVVHGLRSTGSVAVTHEPICPTHAESSQTRD